MKIGGTFQVQVQKGLWNKKQNENQWNKNWWGSLDIGWWSSLKCKSEKVSRIRKWNKNK